MSRKHANISAATPRRSARPSPQPAPRHGAVRRRGSILLFVVGILLLLAVIGTAFLGTTRIDRDASQKFADNTRIDLLLRGLETVVLNELNNGVQDISAQAVQGVVYRPASTTTQTYAFDGVDSTQDPMFADRIPRPLVVRTGPAITDYVFQPGWSALTWSPTGAGLPGVRYWDAGLVDAPARVMSFDSPWQPEAADTGNVENPRSRYNKFLELAQEWQADTNIPPQARVRYVIGDLVYLSIGGQLRFFNCVQAHVSVAATSPLVEQPAAGGPFWEEVAGKSQYGFMPTTMTLGGRDYPAFIRVNNRAQTNFENTSYSPISVLGFTIGGDSTPYYSSWEEQIRNVSLNSLTPDQLDGCKLLAADADNDGVADSGLYKLPVPASNGVDWYYSIRVVDNNSAVNLNTAMTRGADFIAGNTNTPAVINAGWFLGNIGLQELTAGGDYYREQFGITGNLAAQLRELQGVRWKFFEPGMFPGNSADQVTIDNVIYAMTYVRPAANTTDGSVFSGQSYLSQAHALHDAMARRLRNPAILLTNGQPGPPLGTYFPRTFTAGDGTDLVYRGGSLLDLNETSALAMAAAAGQVLAPSIVEDSTYGAKGRFNGGGYPGAPASSDVLVKAAVNSPFTAMGYAGIRKYTINSFALSGPLDSVDNWYTYGFEHHIVGSSPLDYVHQARSLSTTFNPVNVLMPVRNGYSTIAQAPLTATSPFVLDVPRSIRAWFETTTASSGGGLPAGNRIIPADGMISKVNPNIAEFGELWIGFWGVMADNWRGLNALPPYQTTGGLVTPTVSGTVNFATGTVRDDLIRNYETQNSTTLLADDVRLDPYLGMHFVDAGSGVYLPASFDVGRRTLQTPAPRVATLVDGVTTITDAEYNPAGMFRNVIRSQGTPGVNSPRLRPDQMVLLRSALAATNLEEMRDRDFAIGPRTPAGVLLPPREITLISYGTGAAATPRPVTVKLFGLEAQPYITEVLLNTDTFTVPAGASVANAEGYIAIELYNPHPFPIDIRNCKFAVADARTAGVTTGDYLFKDAENTLSIDLNAAVSNLTDAAHFDPTAIPAYGYLVLESYSASGAAGGTGDSNNRPVGARFGTRLATSVVGTNQGSINRLIPTEPMTTLSPTDGMPNINVAYVPGLAQLIGTEFHLVRPLGYNDVGGSSGAANINAGSVTIGNAANVTALVYNEPPYAAGITDASEMAPLDGYDSTNMLVGTSAYWHYVRANVSQPDMILAGGPLPQPSWEFVYPGRYDGSQVGTATEPLSRHQGTQHVEWTTPLPDPWDTAPPTTPAVTLGGGETLASFPRGFRIQLNNYQDPPLDYGRTGTFNAAQLSSLTTGSGLVGAMPNAYPYGGFGRVLDTGRVPFIGSYTISAAGGGVGQKVEMNPVTFDAAFAEDTDLSNDPQYDVTAVLPAIPGLNYASDASFESPGLFAPLMPDDGNPLTKTYTTYDYTTYATLSAPPDPQYDDTVQHPYRVYDPAITDFRVGLNRYRFAARLPDFFSVITPATDQVTNLNQGAATLFPGLNTSRFNGMTQPVSTAGYDASDVSPVVPLEYPERQVPIEGQININTADWRTLSMIPWVPDGRRRLGFSEVLGVLEANPAVGGAAVVHRYPGTAIDMDDNVDIARAIVAWRDGWPQAGLKGHGPFRSMHDLYQVPALRMAQEDLLNNPASLPLLAGAAIEPADKDGDLTPPFTARYMDATATNFPGDGVRFDAEEQGLIVNRVSNLITLQSDAFTVYLTVQGWENAGTSEANMVLEKHKAFIVDRSGVQVRSGGTLPTVPVARKKAEVETD